MTSAVSTLLPPNATGLETALATVAARVSDVPVPVDRLWTPETCPAELLPWMAWALSVDTWDAAWPEAVKRDVIAASFAVHVRKGTVGSLKRGISALGFVAKVTEWFESGGPPHTFTVDVLATRSLRGVPLDEPGQIALMLAIANTKNVRSHAAMRLGVQHDSTLALASGAEASTALFARGHAVSGQHQFFSLGLTSDGIPVTHGHMTVPSGTSSSCALAVSASTTPLLTARMSIS